MKEKQKGFARMMALVQELPEQIAASAEILDRSPVSPLDGVREVHICGMGGSAAAASLAQGIFSSTHIPIFVHRSYHVPLHLDTHCLLIFSSYSGDTEEVLTALEMSLKVVSDAPRIAITSGGTLARRAGEIGFPVLELPTGLPPRASLGYGVGVLFGLLGRIGLVEGMEEGLAEATEILREGNRLYGSEGSGQSAPETLARELEGKLLLLVCGNPITEAVAWRIKAQINENAKSLAYVGVLPEINHNEVVGFQLGGGKSHAVSVLGLEDPADHPRVSRRFAITRKILQPKVDAWNTVRGRGRTDVARAMSLVQLGDYLSVHLADRLGVDPMGVQAIDRLKCELGDTNS